MTVYLAKYAESLDLYGIKLIDASAGGFRSNPTLAAGDVKISKDGGSSNNLATLPDVLPAAGTDVHVMLSASELTCRVASVTFIDVAGGEWDDLSFQIFTFGHPSAYFPFDFGSPTVTLSASQVDQLVDVTWDAQRSDHTVLGSFGEGVKLSQTERDSLSDNILDKVDTIETGVSLRKALRAVLAASAGLLNGAGTDTLEFRNAVANDKVRLTVQTTEAGNRLSIVYDLS